MTIKDIKALISQVEYKSDYSEAELHRQIFDHFKDDAAHTRQYRDQCPPLDLLCYAIKNVMHPDLISSQIPDLLDLLCNVELYRQKAYIQAKETLVWNDKCTKDDGENALTYSERRSITSIERPDQNAYHRSMFCKVVSDLCELDIYQLWISRHSYLLPRRLAEYFPNLKLSDTPSSQLFHLLLSESEKRDFHLVEQICTDFLKNANSWEANRMKHFNARRLSDLMYEESEFFSYERDFMAAFPNHVNSAALIARIDRYLAQVQQAVHCLEKILLDDNTSAD